LRDRHPPGRRVMSPQGWVHGVSRNYLPSRSPLAGVTIRPKVQAPTLDIPPKAPITHPQNSNLDQ